MSPTRRRFLLSGAALSLVSLAGCGAAGPALPDSANSAPIRRASRPAPANVALFEQLPCHCGCGASIGDRHLLGVQSPDVVVPPLSDDAAVPDENAANHRVRHHSVTPQLRELECPAHESSTVVHANRAHEPAFSS